VISTWACLASAENQIPSTHQYLISAKEHLTIAIECADNYTKTWHSIYWNGSRASVKRNVRERLHDLAFDCFTHFLTAADYLDKYAGLMDEQGHPLAKWWKEVNISFALVYASMTKENGHQIYCRQLRLMG